MKKILFLSINILISTCIFAQQGKDGAGNISAANTVVNNVSTTLSANAALGSTSIVVTSTVGLSAGDLLFIVQMQGAVVNAFTQQYVNPNDALPNDTSSGKIVKSTGYNGAGNNEFAEINSISGNTITLNCALSDSFRGNMNSTYIRTQVIRVPRYSSLTLSGLGSITCNTWDGTKGGVVVIEVQGNTTLAAGTSINASSKGFRGGSPLRATGFGSTSTGHNYGTPGSNNGAHKGESIVGDTNVYKLQSPTNLGTIGNYNGANGWTSTPLAICKANVANGGGGGDAMNCGGGGGSNGGAINLWNGMGNPDATYAAIWNFESTTPANGTVRPTSSSGGGRGGYAFSANSNSSADPTANGPNAAGVWGGDNRHNDGGWGGTPLDYSTGKIFLGGGGGAGDGNDGRASGGGNGGGIIFLVSYGTVTGAGQIISDGGSPLPTSSFGSGVNGDDGAGGGGGGGAILINSVGTISLTAATPISAQGGKGGDNNYGGISTTNCYGPGGGGGGGYVAVSNAVASTNINAGANGLITGGGNTSRIKGKFPPNGATSGGAGSIATSVAPFYLTATNYTVCASSAVSLSVTVNGAAPSGLAVSWYTVATGGTAISNSNPYGITAPAAAGTYTYYAGTCPGTYRLPVLVTVNSSIAPTLSVSATNTLICSGTTVTLTISGANSYTWDANAGNATTNTVAVSPNTNTTYTVTGATTGACAGTNTTSITINVNTPPTITITPTSYSICSGVTDTLKASGATSYTWSANAGSATTSSVSILPATIGNTTYSVTGVSGACTSTQSVTINVTATPTVGISPTSAYICKGSNTTFTASGATTFSWSTSATTNTVSVSPTSNTTYTVTGNNGNCAGTKTVLVKVDNGIIKADSISNTATCGQSNGSYVLNSVTGGISPYQINFNSSATFTSIPAFSYTVGGLTGNSYPISIKDSLGCTYTTSVTIGNTSGITKVDSSTTNTNCNASVGIININSITGGTASYQANIDGGTFNTINSFPFAFPNLSAGTHTVVVKDATGCQHTSLIQVNSNGGPSSVATSTVQADTCGKNVGTITVGAITGGTTPYQYSLDGVTYQTANTFTALATNTYTLYVKDNTGCSITSSAIVGSISGSTSVSVTVIPDTCNKHVGVILLSQITGGTSPYTYALNGAYQTASTFTALPATTYTVHVKDNSGCIYTVSPGTTVVSIISVTTPTIAASGNTTFCSGGSITLTSSSASSYTWSTGVNTQTIAVNASGVYTVTTTSPTGCTSMDTITVKVNPNPTTATVNDTTISECSNSIQQIHFNHSAGLLIIHNSAGQIQSLPFTPSTSGTYTAYDSLNGCISSVKNITVKINATPTIVPTVTTPVTYCQGKQADTLKAITTTAGADLVWQDANHNTILTPPTPTPSTNIAGTITYYVYQSIGVCNGPVDSIKVIVIGKPNPNFTINPAIDIFVGQTIAFSPVQTTTTNTYHWSFDDPASTIANTSTAGLPSHTYNTASSYCPKLVVTNQAGCKDSTTLCLDVLTGISIVIPNVFSPNGDGLNDVFSVKATGYTNFSCDIFDRWGLKLYSWTGVSGYWDGSEKTSKAVDGTYFYVIQTTDVKGEDHKYNGFIQLIK
jgi:gliding motility-associated-like protein